MLVEWVSSRQTALPRGNHCTHPHSAGSGFIVIRTMGFLSSLSPNETAILSCISRKRPPLVRWRTRGGLY